MKHIIKTAVDFKKDGSKEFTLEFQTNEDENSTRLLISKYDPNCNGLLLGRYMVEDDTEYFLNVVSQLLEKHVGKVGNIEMKAYPFNVDCGRCQNRKLGKELCRNGFIQSSKTDCICYKQIPKEES